MSSKRQNAIGNTAGYRYRSPHVPTSAIRRFAKQIGERFDPDQIILFGSYAYGHPHDESDVDLLVVMPAANQINQAIRITRAFEPPFSLDLIVRTPEKLHRGLEEGNWFLHDIKTRGKVLYEKGNGTLGPQSRSRSARSQKPRSHKATGS